RQERRRERAALDALGQGDLRIRQLEVREVGALHRRHRRRGDRGGRSAKRRADREPEWCPALNHAVDLPRAMLARPSRGPGEGVPPAQWYRAENEPARLLEGRGPSLLETDLPAAI